MIKEITELFELISKPIEDKVGGEKLFIMREWLHANNVESEWIPGIGLIVNKQDNPRITLVSHMDLIKKFQKGFAKNETFEVDSKFITGALDNTLTNVMSLLLIKELVSDKNSDIEFFFSEGEEVGLVGMNNYLKEFPEKSKNTFFVNLDVTNDGWGKAVSLEYDKPDFETIKQLQNILASYNIHYQVERVGDDMSAIVRKGYKGFSYCIPTKGVIHSYKNKCKINLIEEFYNSLKDLILSLKIEHEYSVFDSDYFDLAIKEKTFKDFSEKRKSLEDKKKALASRAQYRIQTKAQNSKQLLIEKYGLTIFQVNERTKFVDQVLDYIVFDKGFTPTNDFEKFILKNVMKDSSFFVEDFADKLEVAEKTAKELLKELKGFGIVLEYEKGVEYKFPCPDFMSVA